MDKRRIPPIVVIGLFMAVTVGHVAGYVGQFEHDGMSWLGWPYAIAVDTAIVVCAAFTRWETTRRVSWVGYAAFVGASGVLNVAYVQPWSRPDWWAAWTFSVFPTAAIALCGLLYRRVDALAGNAERGRQRRAERPADTEVESELAPSIAAVAEHGGNGDRPRLTYAEFCRAYPEVAALTGRQVAAYAGISERAGRLWLARRKVEAV